MTNKIIAIILVIFIFNINIVEAKENIKDLNIISNNIETLIDATLESNVDIKTWDKDYNYEKDIIESLYNNIYNPYKKTSNNNEKLKLSKELSVLTMYLSSIEALNSYINNKNIEDLKFSIRTKKNADSLLEEFNINI